MDSMEGSSTDHQVQKAVDLVCVQTAVDKRETAVAAGFTTYAAAVTAAQAQRKTDLHAAWAMTDATARKDAIKAAWKTFTGSVKTARKALKTGNKAAWSTYKTDRKACGGGESDGEGSGSGQEVQ